MHDQYSYKGRFFTLNDNVPCATIQGQPKSLNDSWTLADILSLDNFSLQTPIAITFENLADIIANNSGGLLPAWINDHLTWANAPVGPQSPAFSASIVNGILNSQRRNPDGSLSPIPQEILEEQVRTLMNTRTLASVGKTKY